MMSFYYPPYDLANLPKLRIPMKAPFKKGETMEDQKIASGGGLRNIAIVGAIVVAFSSAVKRFFT